MIYVCYGATKSASTFLYQVTEEIFSVAGRKPFRLGPPLRPKSSLDNYFDTIDADLIGAVAKIVGNRDIVLKTHGRPGEGLAELIASGAVLASASIRDPREIALSLLDHGRRARRWRHIPFREFRTLADTFSSLDTQMQYFQAWASLGKVEVFHYNDICFDTAAVIDRIAAQTGLDVVPDRVLESFKDNRITGQFNKGIAYRYREMPQSDQAVFLERYAELYRAVDFGNEKAERHALPDGGASKRPRGQLAQEIINFRRRLRF